MISGAVAFQDVLHGAFALPESRAPGSRTIIVGKGVSTQSCRDKGYLSIVVG